MKLFLVWFVLVGNVLAICNPSDKLEPIWNLVEYPCNEYFKACRFHHEGREGKLLLPVRQSMIPPLLEIFEYGDVNITFSHPINALDVPEGDHGQRKVEENQKFTLFIKDVYRDRLEGLKEGDIFDLDITFRSQMLKPGYTGPKLGISALSFGRFQCPPPPPPLAEEVVLPKCEVVMLDQSMTDGYRAVAIFPIQKNTQQWEAEIVFPIDVRVFDTPSGDKVPTTPTEDTPKRGLVVTSYRHNGVQKKGQEFKLEFTIHFNVNLSAADKKLSKNIVSMRFNEWKCEGVVRRNRIWV